MLRAYLQGSGTHSLAGRRLIVRVLQWVLDVIYRGQSFTLIHPRRNERRHTRPDRYAASSMSEIGTEVQVRMQPFFGV